MDRTEAKNIQEVISEALANMGYNVKITGRFSDTGFSFRVEGNQTDTASVNKINKRVDAEIGFYLLTQGIKDVGDTFVGRKVKDRSGDTYTITGFNSRRSKYPIDIQSSTGRTYKCSASQLVWN